MATPYLAHETGTWVACITHYGHIGVKLKESSLHSAFYGAAIFRANGLGRGQWVKDAIHVLGQWWFNKYPRDVRSLESEHYLIPHSGAC